MSEAFIGEIKMFGGNFSPRNWAFCAGQILSIAENTALFSLIGTTYGGDGRVSFALPDLRGRAPLAPGNGPGLMPRRLGQRGGSNSVSLTAAEIPVHTHQMQATSVTATETTPSGNNLATGNLKGRGGSDKFYDGTVNTSMSPSASEITGSGTAHQNMQPYLVCNFIICLFGIYPSRS
ncbi:MAG: tail fiber protein [Mariprofundaceae bacterium]